MLTASTPVSTHPGSALQAQLEFSWHCWHHLMWLVAAGVWGKPLQPTGLHSCDDSQHAVRLTLDHHTDTAARQSRLQWSWSIWRSCRGPVAAHTRQDYPCSMHFAAVQASCAPLYQPSCYIHSSLCSYLMCLLSGHVKVHFC